MRFSIIIPTHNRKKLLEKCLRSLLAQEYDSDEYEIIVIDDGSSDGSQELIRNLRKTAPNIRYFRNRHSGPGHARNTGLKKANGEYVAFTDDDCVVEKDWLRKIEREFERTGVDVVGGSIINPTEKYIAWSQYILNFSSWFPKGANRAVRDIPTANICYWKKAVAGHYFTEHPGDMGYEDSLYNFHLYKENNKMLCCPDISVRHHTWEENYGLRKFFMIQKKTALGFVAGGYKVHGSAGYLLVKLKFLNLFCPRLMMVFYRCFRYGYLTRFLYCFPLLLAGEFYRGYEIFIANKK